jgi:hypothetical protein
MEQPGAALACPYCGGFIGFNEHGSLEVAPSIWPVLRYSRTALEEKKIDDGEDAQTPLAEWALRVRFIQPGVHRPLENYVYAEDAPANETVP